MDEIFNKLSYSTLRDHSANTLLIVDGAYNIEEVVIPDVFDQLLTKTQTRAVYKCLPSRYFSYPRHLYHTSSIIRIRNIYEGFHDPYTLNGVTTYPNWQILSCWKRKHQLAHLCIGNNVRGGNVINLSLFSNIQNFQSNVSNTSFILKWHQDSDNYWHWMFEWLPRLIILKKYFQSLPGRRSGLEDIRFFVLGSALTKFQKDSIHSVLGFMPEILYESRGINLRNVIESPLSFTTHHDKQLLKDIKSIVFSAFPEASQSIFPVYKFLYVLRGNAKNGRRLANEKDVCSLLAGFGFKSVSMDGLSIFQQANLFSNADIIIGCHGSAFINMIYCKSGTKILEIFGDNYISGHEYSLARNCDVSWEIIRAQNISNSNSNFYIDLRIIKNRLHEILPLS